MKDTALQPNVLNKHPKRSKLVIFYIIGIVIAAAIFGGWRFIAPEATLAATGMQQLEGGTFMSKVDRKTYPYSFVQNKDRLCSGPRSLAIPGGDPNLGYHNFLIIDNPGDNPNTLRPLYVYMHGGGVSSWITNADGTKSLDPISNYIVVHEETKQELLARMSGDKYPLPAWKKDLQWPPTKSTGLPRKVANSRQYRTLIVSHCDNDLYAGISTVADPDNPYPGPTGESPKVDGLLALREAIDYTKSIFNTSKIVAQGCSAGGFGVMNLAHDLEITGGKLDAIISDTGADNEVLDDLKDMGLVSQMAGNWRNWRPKIGYYTTYGSDINNRTYPNLAYKAIRDGRILMTPIYAVWSPNDNEFGGTRENVSKTFLPLTDAVAVGNPGGYPVGDVRRSRVREVCTNSNCNKHCPLENGADGSSPDATLINDVFTWMEKIRTDNPNP